MCSSETDRQGVRIPSLNSPSETLSLSLMVPLDPCLALRAIRSGVSHQHLGGCAPAHRTGLWKACRNSTDLHNVLWCGRPHTACFSALAPHAGAFADLWRLQRSCESVGSYWSFSETGPPNLIKMLCNFCHRSNSPLSTKLLKMFYILRSCRKGGSTLMHAFSLSSLSMFSAWSLLLVYRHAFEF